MTKSAEENRQKFREWMDTFTDLTQHDKFVVEKAANWIWSQQPKEQPAGEWEVKKHPLQGTWAVMHRKEGFTTDFDLYYATSQPAADRLKSLLNASDGDSVEFAEWIFAHLITAKMEAVYDTNLCEYRWRKHNDKLTTADLYTQFKNQKEGR